MYSSDSHSAQTTLVIPYTGATDTRRTCSSALLAVRSSYVSMRQEDTTSTSRVGCVYVSGTRCKGSDRLAVILLFGIQEPLSDV